MERRCFWLLKGIVNVRRDRCRGQKDLGEKNLFTFLYLVLSLKIVAAKRESDPSTELLTASDGTIRIYYLGKTCFLETGAIYLLLKVFFSCSVLPFRNNRINECLI